MNNNQPYLNFHLLSENLMVKCLYPYSVCDNLCAIAELSRISCKLSYASNLDFHTDGNYIICVTLNHICVRQAFSRVFYYYYYFNVI